MQKSKPILTHAYLREHLHYSVITGQFYWLEPIGNNKIKTGYAAGSLHNSGYKTICINGKSYASHRLAWFWVTGEWPENEIDHKSGIKDANYWLNLREATRSQNCCNTRIHSNNVSGYKGVSWKNANQKWVAQIMLNNKKKHIGLFGNIEDAYKAYCESAKKIHGHFAKLGEIPSDILFFNRRILDLQGNL